MPKIIQDDNYNADNRPAIDAKIQAGMSLIFWATLLMIADMLGLAVFRIVIALMLFAGIGWIRQGAKINDD